MLARPRPAAIVAALLLTVGLATAAPTSAAGEASGSVSGRVLRHGLDAWEGRTPSITAYRWVDGHWQDQPTVSAATDGTYTVAGLAPGEYRVGFSSYTASGHTYEQVYDGASTLAAGDPVVVTAGGTTTGIDGVLDRPSTISGRVTDDRGRPVEGVRVRAGYFFGDSWTAGVTDARGRYRIEGEVGGALRLKFEPVDPLRLDTWWPGIPGAGEEGAVDLVVPPNADVEDVDVVVPIGGGIAGKLPNPDVLPNAPVAWQRRDGAWVAVATGDVIGGGQPVYSVGGLPPGSHRVCFSQSTNLAGTCVGGSDVDSAATLKVDAGRVTRRDHAAVPPGAITGRITLGSGETPDYVRVTAYRRTGTGYAPVTSAVVGVGSDFALTPLSPDRYRIGIETEVDRGFDAGWGTQEFWPDAHSLETGRDIIVGAGEVVSGRDVAIDEGATIVAERQGEYAAATAYRRTSSGAWLRVVANPVETETGVELQGLRPGTYRLGFGVNRPWFTRTVPAYWDRAATIAGARDIVVRLMSDRITGISVTVPAGSAIVGSLYAPKLVPRRLADIGDVVAYRKVGAHWVEESRDRPTGRLDGRFAIAGLPAGTYRIGFEPDDSFWGPAFHGPDGPRSLADAADVTVPAATDVEGIDIVVPAVVRNVAAPRLIGVARVGRVLRAVAGVWSPTGVGLRYAWFADGRAIPGATGTTYRLRNRDRGRRISVRVTGRRGHGFDPATARSARSARVQPRQG